MPLDFSCFTYSKLPRHSVRWIKSSPRLMLLQLIFDFPNLHRSYVIEHRQSTERLCFRIDWYFCISFRPIPTLKQRLSGVFKSSYDPRTNTWVANYDVRLKQRHLNEIVGISASLRAVEYVLCVMIFVRFLTFWYVG